MDTRFIQSRDYNDTFDGGEYHLEMTENLSAIGPIPINMGDFDLKTERQNNHPEIQDMIDYYLGLEL